MGPPASLHRPTVGLGASVSARERSYTRYCQNVFEGSNRRFRRETDNANHVPLWPWALIALAKIGVHQDRRYDLEAPIHLRLLASSTHQNKQDIWLLGLFTLLGLSWSSEAPRFWSPSQWLGPNDLLSPEAPPWLNKAPCSTKH